MKSLRNAIIIQASQSPLFPGSFGGNYIGVKYSFQKYTTSLCYVLLAYNISVMAISLDIFKSIHGGYE